MFTGIIQAIGSIVSWVRHGDGAQLSIKAPWDSSDIAIGESIAVNGCCLTVVKKRGAVFFADLSQETLALTTFAQATVGEKVNLERALRLSDRLGGHMVTGHVDAVGAIRSLVPRGDCIHMTVAVAPEFLNYIVHKGSIAIDGVSLTVSLPQAKKPRGVIDLDIVPHTGKKTTLGFKKPGDRVNIEVDYLAKLVEKRYSEYYGQ